MSKTRYLQQLGHSWYLRVKVPPGLQITLRNTHIRRALRTRDLDEANRRKWPALAQLRAFFDALAAGATIEPVPIAVATTSLPPPFTATPAQATTYERRAGLRVWMLCWKTGPTPAP